MNFEFSSLEICSVSWSYSSKDQNEHHQVGSNKIEDLRLQPTEPPLFKRDD